MKKKVIVLAIVSAVIALGLIAYAYISTWGKTELNVNLHINEELVLRSGFGESPTFAIWLEHAVSGEIRAVYVTRRAAEGDWEGKADVPVALPRWFELQRKMEKEGSGPLEVDAYSGATPKPGYFTAKAELEPGSSWLIWIEVNLAADYNKFYPASENEDSETDKYLSGQPAIIYRAKIEAVAGNSAKPELLGITLPASGEGKVIQPLYGITTAAEIFSEMIISVEKPKPKIIKK